MEMGTKMLKQHGKGEEDISMGILKVLVQKKIWACDAFRCPSCNGIELWSQHHGSMLLCTIALVSHIGKGKKSNGI